MYLASSAAPYGKKTFIPDSFSACSRALPKHFTSELYARPRGSKPTMSNLSSTSELSHSGEAIAMSVPGPPGPPGFTNRLPILFAWSRALTRATATSTVLPPGLS
jgi:hypothetical protein